MNELEEKFSEVSDLYIKAKEELAALRVTEINLNEQLVSANQGRQNFKEQYLEMREVNKDLKLHFGKLQQRIDGLEAGDKAHEQYFAGQNQPNSKRNRRYDSSEEEENERHSRERPSAKQASSNH